MMTVLQLQLARLEAAHTDLHAESVQVTGEQARRCSGLEVALERERQRAHALERRSGRRLSWRSLLLQAPWSSEALCRCCMRPFRCFGYEAGMSAV